MVSEALLKLYCIFIESVSNVMPQLFCRRFLFVRLHLHSQFSFSLSSHFLTTTLSSPVASAMLSVVQHSKCGLYLVHSHTGNHQILVNGITGEEHDVQRSEDMVKNNIFYLLCFNKSGMAYLVGGAGKLWVSGMHLNKVAVSDVAGRIAIQDSSTNGSHWADDTHAMMQRTTKTLKLNSKCDLVFTTFGTERDILESRLGSSPHQLGGTVFWEFRCLKQTILVEDEKPDVQATWEKRNFHNVYGRWEQLFEIGGGVHPASHWFLSEKAWNTKQAQANLQLLLCLNPSVLIRG